MFLSETEDLFLESSESLQNVGEGCEGLKGFNYDILGLGIACERVLVVYTDGWDRF